jgi:exosortase
MQMASETGNIQATGRPQAPAGALQWPAIAWFTALLLACYTPTLVPLVRQWVQDQDMGHGFFVPVLAGYIAWQKRQELMSAPASPNWWGLAIVAYGAFQFLIATLGAELFLARTALIISLIGVVLFMGGTRALRILAFPLFLLCFMVPIPAVIYSQITFPMQLLASQVADSALSLLGIPVLREGNILELASRRLNVVEACSGIRSLLSLSFLSVVYSYFFDQRVWMRVILLAATLPISIVANASRVTLTGVVSAYNAELAEGIFHYASGWVIFMVALVILVAFHQSLSMILRKTVSRS